MDQKLFEEKLSEVAEWRKEPISNEDLATKGLRPLCENPTEIIIDKIKPSPCPYTEGNMGCFFVTKWYIHTKHTRLKITSCKTCNTVITPKGHIMKNQTMMNIASKVYWFDHKE